MKLKKKNILRNTMEAGNNKVLDFKRKSINIKSSTDEKLNFSEKIQKK